MLVITAPESTVVVVIGRILDCTGEEVEDIASGVTSACFDEPDVSMFDEYVAGVVAATIVVM